MSYVTKLLSSAAVALLLVAALNYATDPYGAFDRTIDHTPETALLFEANVRLAKAHIVARYRPEAVILGSSRVEIGISPADPNWRHDRVYNLGLPQATLQEIVEYLEHAIALGSLEQVVIGLDFFQFNPELPPRPDFDECRLLEPGSRLSRFRASICDVPALFFSRKAFFAAISQERAEGAEIVYLRDGNRSAEAKEGLLRSSGSQHVAFLKTEYRDFEESELLSGLVSSDDDDDVQQSAGPHFDELLRLAHRNGIDLRLFLSPSHARHWELLDKMELWDDFVRWKRYLLRSSHRIAREFDAPPYPVWDFADYNVFTTEPLPPLGDVDARMRWHWESSHYTEALGGKVLEEVLGGKTTGLGAKLEAATFDEWAAAIETRRAEYRKTAADELALMHRYLESPSLREEMAAQAE